VAQKPRPFGLLSLKDFFADAPQPAGASETTIQVTQHHYSAN
jgi:hypothetical protein